MIDPVLLAKFRKRAPLFQSQEHLDRAMLLFPVDQHEEIAAIIQPLLKNPITARKVEFVEFKPRDPESPTLTESTVQRLNTMAAEIETLKTAHKPLEERIAVLEGERDTQVAVVESLAAEVGKLKAVIDERDATITKLTADAAVAVESKPEEKS